MSWSRNVSGLVRLKNDIVFVAHEEDPDNWEHAVPDHFCAIDGTGEAMTACKSGGFSSHSWSRSIAAAGATAVVADYYAVSIGFTSPGNFDFAFDGCDDPDPASSFGCGPGLPVLINASLSGDSYLATGNSTTGSPVSVPTEGTTMDNSPWRFRHPAALNDGGVLENMAPVWPAPDAFGNEYGRVLFTRAQMLALPDVTFYTEAWDHAGPDFDLFGVYTYAGRTRISITPYNLLFEPPPTSSMCIVDCA